MIEKVEGVAKEGKSGEIILVALFYKYCNVKVKNPKEQVEIHRKKCEALMLTGRIRIATEGINGTIEGSKRNIYAYKRFLDESEFFDSIDFKTSTNLQPSRLAFASLVVKYTEELVTLGKPLDEISKERGTHLKPAEFHSFLESHYDRDDFILLDVRNAYESKIGHFKNAVKPRIRNYAAFPRWVENNIDMLKSKKAVAMYCTGGIRCETASAVLKSRGVKGKVVQLSGGIHRYLESFPDSKSLYLGKNFVFDRRRTDGLKGKGSVGRCDKCGIPHDDYFDEAVSERICCHICKMLVLICPACEDSDTPFYCDEHAVWRSASAEWVRERISSLQDKLKSLPKLLKKDRPRSIKSVHREIEYCEEWLLAYQPTSSSSSCGQSHSK